MSAEPLLPTSEKQPIDEVHPKSTGLRLGGEKPTLAERFRGLSTVRKVLLVGAFAWLVTGALHGLTQAFANPHGPHHGFHFNQQGGCSKHAAWEDVEPTVTVATYAAPIDFFDGTEVLQTANATFPLAGGDLSVAFDGEGAGERQIVVSRADVEAAEVDVESVWGGETVEGVQMTSTPFSDALSIEWNDQARHIVHLVLPISAESIPSLSLWSPATLRLVVHPSAAQLPFDALSVSADGDVFLPTADIDDLSIETKSGDVTGSFNVTKALVIHTVTGDITAVVHVHPLFPPHGPNSTHPHPPPPHHKSAHEDFEHEEHGHQEHGHGHGHEHEHEYKHEHEHEHDEEHEDHEDHDDDYEHENEDEEERGPRWEKRGKREHKSHEKKSVRGLKRSEYHHPHPDREARGRAGWFPFSFGPFDNEEDRRPGRDAKEPKGPKGPKGPPGPPGRRPPHPPPPPPVFIGAFTTTGKVNVSIHAPPFVSTVVKTLSRTGSVHVTYPTFKGFYEAATLVGSVHVAAPHKEKKVLKEVVGETGSFIKGLIFPFKKNSTLAGGTDAESDEFMAMEFHDEEHHGEGRHGFKRARGLGPRGNGGRFWPDQDGEFPPPPPGREGEFPPPPPGKGGKFPPPPPGKGDKRPPPPPGKGGKFPPPPPGKFPPPPPGKGGKHPPPPPGKGGKFPPPPPGKGGKFPPPPPGKGGKHPPPPPGKGGKPPHHPPPPPGFSKVIGKTDVGTVTLFL